MARPQMNFDITADNAQKIERDYVLKKREDKAPPKPPTPKQATTPKEAPPAFTAKDQKLLLNQVEKLSKDQEKLEKKAEADQKKKNSLLLKYQRYYSHPLLSGFLPKPRPIGPNNSVADITFALDEVRQAIAVHRAGDFMKTAIDEGGQRVADLMMATGIAAALKIPNLEGFVKTSLLPATKSPLLEVEMAEFEVEFQDWFTMPCWMRASSKIYALAKGHSDGLAMMKMMEQKTVINSPPSLDTNDEQ